MKEQEAKVNERRESVISIQYSVFSGARSRRREEVDSAKIRGHSSRYLGGYEFREPVFRSRLGILLPTGRHQDALIRIGHEHKTLDEAASCSSRCGGRNRHGGIGCGTDIGRRRHDSVQLLNRRQYALQVELNCYQRLMRLRRHTYEIGSDRANEPGLSRSNRSLAG